ncbi:MAG: TIGR01548 family HAD-type hydrolase [Leptolyngbyaceae cyanobacterium RM2_2_4]|nr:TIGR01548 family HAD-type hydrolase [Leptolyngbyaceae cyanobacterium SM1_4_3]NJO51075.1 TIGR01548 family HAD-type hydrolase [Leptolyngbyaceae cyanobacterium RM2_2_4]
MTQQNQAFPPAIVIFDIDGVIRDVGGSYRRALADTVEQFTQSAYRPSTTDIDVLKAEGRWNNDWEGSQELIYRHFEGQGVARSHLNLNYDDIIAFFQSRYRGPDPHYWTGYICQEPLLLSADYFEQLTQAGIPWGFFSGATRGSALYVLEKRLGLRSPILIAMEDAPGKPDPTGLLEVVQQLEPPQPETEPLTPTIYLGDTVADLQTVVNASEVNPSRQWIGVGILPPHTQTSAEYAAAYAVTLQEAGAAIVLNNVQQLTLEKIKSLALLKISSAEK